MNDVKEYINFKIKQLIRLKGIDTKGMSQAELSEIVKPYLDQWVREYAQASGN